MEVKTLEIKTHGEGLFDITDKVNQTISNFDSQSGHCNIFIQHTSASLVIQENSDPSAKFDLEQWLKRLVPENNPNFTHTFEGPDDMPSHIKAALTQTSIVIPVIDGTLMLGTWQGLYLWEHRRSPHLRRVMVSLIS